MHPLKEPAGPESREGAHSQAHLYYLLSKNHIGARRRRIAAKLQTQKDKGAPKSLKPQRRRGKKPRSLATTNGLDYSFFSLR